MSGFSRKMYQLKSHVGVSNKTTDTDIQIAKTRLGELQKKFKNAQSVIKKLSPTIHATNLMQVEVLTTLKDIVNQKENSMYDNIDTVITTFQNLDSGVVDYEKRIEEEIMTPLKVFTEQFKTLDKRFDTCHTRRVDMDRFHEKVLDISKKPPGKQVGLAEAQAKYNKSRDLYNYLRSEILVDMDNIAKSFEQVVGPICTIIISAYTNYINHINNYWERAIEVCPNFKFDTINTEHVITPADQSMMLEANVTAAKERDKAMNKDDSSSSSSSDDEKPKVVAAPVTKSMKKPPPPPGRKREQVKCEYDYTAQEDGELSFREGDVITVLKKEGDWWYGELRGVEGLFPYNYVSPL